mmetsp:Transcript_106897/g.189994  ORF Transcript_106897/g.189994 Transcript_106897/m.189994 type:complete len:105 (+) Transcript_106897:76-390(+)
METQLERANPYWHGASKDKDISEPLPFTWNGREASQLTRQLCCSALTPHEYRHQGIPSWTAPVQALPLDPTLVVDRYLQWLLPHQAQQTVRLKPSSVVDCVRLR